jgi:hypothetical protein
MQQDRTAFEQQAYELGAEAARAAATWANDSASPESAERVLRMLENGDPEAWDYLPPAPNLSGGWGTPNRIATKITGDATDDLDQNLINAIADAYEQGVSDTFEDACVTELRRWLPEHD